ncbi:hypothetical protein SOVF_044650 [Spinacia oleracea]|nr:hypothetical protein SOVF_044650 [Spinacia oleracea]
MNKNQINLNTIPTFLKLHGPLSKMFHNQQQFPS